MKRLCGPGSDTAATQEAFASLSTRDTKPGRRVSDRFGPTLKQHCQVTAHVYRQNHAAQDKASAPQRLATKGTIRCEWARGRGGRGHRTHR